MGAAFAVFWGTMWPVISEALRGQKATVNASFFNQVVGPILLAIVILMGICPLIGWRGASVENLIRNFRIPAAIGVIAAVVSYFLGANQIYALIGLAACGFVVGTVALEFFRGAQAKGRILGKNPLVSLPFLVWGNKSRYGGYLVHVGIILMAIGVIGSQGFQIQKDVTLTPGQEATIGSYRLVYNSLTTTNEGKKDVVAASITAYNGSQLLGTMTPSKEFYQGYDSPNTEVSIRSTPAEDLYLILSSWDQQQKAVFRLVINPLVTWIWIGGYVLLLGIIVAFWPDAKKHQEAMRLAEERSLPKGMRTAGA